jgi:ADP-heptose:LPS heptosyltransferase
MGLGDHMMAAGLAEDLYRQDPTAGPVAIVDVAGTLRYQSLWLHNPAIASTLTATTRTVRCGAGCLPYLDVSTAGQPFVFSQTYKAREHRGSLVLTDEELAHGRQLRGWFGRYVVVEPHGTDRKNPNRQWPLADWQYVTWALLKVGVKVVQLGHEYTNSLSGVHVEPVRDIRDSAAILAAADLVLATEGGVPFITAPLGTPTVVLWGGCVSFEALHYPEQVNLIDPDPCSPCGSKQPCDHCRAIWDRLSPAAVVTVVLDTLAGRRHRGVA